MTDPKDLSEQAESGVDSSLYLPPRREGLSLLRKVFFYHLMLAIFMISIPLVFPDFIDQLPIGGIKELEGSGDLRVTTVEENLKPAEDIPIVQTFIR
ncbi:MAG: hypothetical protein OET46_15035, partial [Xanthomonadales bacterium]|nr:hypothetical protein [Xanthomonadales bacterium]